MKTRKCFTFAELPGREVFELSPSANVEPMFGIQINTLSIEDLFNLYERTGFLYPAKRERLAPFWPLVKKNWERLRTLDKLLHYVVEVHDAHSGAITSFCLWRSSNAGWICQHLVSQDNPLATRAALLGTAAAMFLSGTGASYQNWFRPDNRFPARVFGTVPNTLGAAQSAVCPLQLWSLPRSMPAALHHGGSVERVTTENQQALVELTRRCRYPLWPVIEELEEDLDLAGLDAVYSIAGLRRYRRTWMAFQTGSTQPAMAAMVYRGPLGMNFSFLENRCELMIDPECDFDTAQQALPALLGAAVTAYNDFELPYIPLVANAAGASLLISLGAQFVRNYSQCAWLRAAVPEFYQHVNGFYQGMLDHLEHRRMGSARRVAKA